MSEATEAAYPPYLTPIEQELAGQYAFVRDVGEGKNGITYLLRHRHLGLNVCLKTIAPKNQGLDEASRVLDTLTKEVAILSPLNHRCLPRIYAANLTPERPYYLCTYHPGLTWEQLRTAGHTFRLDETIFVVHSLIDTIEYLHENGRTHCDLHQDNILISKDALC